MIMLEITRHGSVYHVQLDSELQEGGGNPEALILNKTLSYPIEPFAIEGHRFVNFNGEPAVAQKQGCLGLANVATIYDQQPEDILVAGSGWVRLASAYYPQTELTDSILVDTKVVLSEEGDGTVRAFDPYTDLQDDIIGVALTEYYYEMPDMPAEPIVKIKFSLLEYRQADFDNSLFTSIYPSANMESRRLVSFGYAHTEQGDPYLGVTRKAETMGVEARIQILGIAHIEAGANVFVGSDLKAGADGKVVLASSSDILVGRCLDEGVSGDIVRVKLL